MSEPGERWLLLHGTPLTPAVWDDVATHLRASGSGPVECPDITPAGHAEDAQDAGDCQADLAKLLAAEIEQLPAAAGLHVVGHSFGGQVALDLVLLAPQRMRSLTIICSRDTPFPAFAPAAASLRRGDPVDTGAVLGRWFIPAELSLGGPVVSYARYCLDSADRLSWAAALDAIAHYDRARPAASVQVPVTLIAAELDRVSTPAAMSAFAGRLPRASLHVLPGAAHMTPFTDPAALAALIRSAAQP
jgi:pimeloyl-ACP methyl ester carboxylesterase